MKFTIAALAATLPVISACWCHSPLKSSSGTTWDVSGLAKPVLEYDSNYSYQIKSTEKFPSESLIRFNFCKEWCMSEFETSAGCGLAFSDGNWVAKSDMYDGSPTEKIGTMGEIYGVSWTMSSDVQCDTDPEQNFSVDYSLYCDHNITTIDDFSIYRNGCYYEVHLSHEAGCPLPATAEDQNDTYPLPAIAEDQKDTTTIEQSTRSLLDYISWTLVDEQKAQVWIESKREDTETRKKNWGVAWKNYQDTVAQPWNDFLKKSEDLSIKDTLTGLETQEEVINYVANNTFIQGQPLIQVFPEIENWLNSISQQKVSIGDNLNFDAFKITPRNLMLADVKQSAHEARHWAEDKIISYGYNKDIVEKWLQDTEATWQELEQRQTQEAAEQAKNDIREAGEYIKKILDNAVADIQQNQDEFQTGYQTAIDQHADDLKFMLDDFVEENVKLLDDYVNMGYATFQQELEKPIDLSISFAEVQSIHESVGESSKMQYAAIAFFTVPWFTIIFAIYTKFYKGRNKEISAIKEPLLSQKEDEEPKCIL